MTGQLEGHLCFEGGGVFSTSFDQIIVFAEIYVVCEIAEKLQLEKKNCDFFSQRFLCQGMVHPRLSMLQIGHSCSISYCIGAFFPQTFKTSSRQRLTLGCMTLVPGHQNAHKVRHQCH